MDGKILLAVAMIIGGGYMFNKMNAIKNMAIAIIAGVIGLGVGISGLVLLAALIAGWV